MLTATHLRLHAETCLGLADAAENPAMADELRRMADEFLERAAATESGAETLSVIIIEPNDEADID